MGVQSNEELGTADVHYRSHSKLLQHCMFVDERAWALQSV